MPNTIVKNRDFAFHNGIFDVNHLSQTTKIFKNDHCEKLRVYRALFTMVPHRRPARITMTTSRFVKIRPNET